MVAAGTILGAEFYGLPASTTHILSSGVAGTMAGNGSANGHDQGHSDRVVPDIPAAMLIAGCLYTVLRSLL
jgi:inorganic phosphate transporter, PiT family